MTYEFRVNLHYVISTLCSNLNEKALQERRERLRDDDSSHYEKLQYWYYQAKSFEFGNIETADPEAYFRTVSNICDVASLKKSGFL